jgi:DNA polymerase V
MQDDEQWLGSRRLMQAVDGINTKFGRDTIKYGIAGLEQNWKTKFEKRSQRFTTNWNELLVIA